MTTTTGAAFAAFLFAGIVAGILAPGFARADVSPNPEGHGSYGHLPQPPTIQVKRAPGNEHNAIVVSWDEAHYHPYPHPSRTDVMVSLGDYRIAIHTVDLTTERSGYWVGSGTSQDTIACEGEIHRSYNYQQSTHPRPAGCILRIVSLNSSGRYSETFSG